MGSIYLIYYECLILRFPDAETNPIPRLPVPAVRNIHSSNKRSLSGNHNDLTVIFSLYVILLF